MGPLRCVGFLTHSPTRDPTHPHRPPRRTPAINCDFDCDGAGWEIKCSCDDKSSSCSLIECKVDRDGAPDAEDILFECESQGDGANPSCATAPLVDPTLAGSCAKNTIAEVLNAWVIGVSDK